MSDTQLSLREVLADLAEDARPVDLSGGVARKARRLRRRRVAAVGAAAAGAVGVSTFAAAQLESADKTTLSVGGAVGASPQAALTTDPVVPAPRASAGPGNTCYTFNNFDQPDVTVAEKQRATAMGKYLCSALGGGAKFGQLEEWVSTGGLSGGYPGRVFNIQAHHPGLGAGNPTEQGEIWISVHKHEASPAAAHVTVSEVDGSLAAVWPDGTTVNLEAGKDTPANRAIIANPVFDAFRP